MTTTNLKGEKLSKNDLQIHLIGALDELNAHLGLVKAKLQDAKEKEFLEKIQINIMKMMSHISDNANKDYFFAEEDAAGLNKEIGEFKFVLPGKDETDAVIHIARTVARRAERCFAAVNEQIPLCRYAAAYLNKLSGHLFYLANVAK